MLLDKHRTLSREFTFNSRVYLEKGLARV